MRERKRGELKKDFKDSCDGPFGPDWVLLIFINPNTSLHSVVFLSTFRSDCAAFIRMTNGRLAETGTFKVFQKTSSSEDFTQ